MAALIIAIFPQNSSRGNWEEQQDRTDPNSQFELARKPAWLLAFRQFGLPKWKHDFECSSLQPLRYASMYKYSLLGTNHMISSQSRYDHFDIAPCLFPPAILVVSKALKNPLERKAGEKAKKYSI